MKTCLLLLVSVCLSLNAQTKYVACEGDSLTAGTGASPTGSSNYVAQMSLILNNFLCQNLGFSGDQIANNTNALDTITHLSTNTVYQQRAAVLWMGINDVAVNNSLSSITNGLAMWVASVRAYDYRVRLVGCTLTPAGLTGTDETKRLGVNTFITTCGIYDSVVDLANDSRLSDSSNTNYYSGDNVHMNNAGYSVVASLVGSAISGLSWMSILQVGSLEGK